MEKRNQKGITLIALIITIIVMLILVAVAVRTAVNSGLFGHAKNATEGWADAQRNELAMDQQVGELIEQHTKGKNHNWKRTGDNIKCEHCELEFEIGDYINYKPDATETTVTIGKEEAGLLETDRTSTSTIDPDTVENQVFTQDKDTKWQVLGVEDSDKNGTNETLLIRMVGGTSTALRLKGAASYNNGPDLMNKIAKELYSSSEYGEARSINVNDVNNTLQYTPGGGFYHEDSIYKETNGFNTKIKDLSKWDTIKGKGTYTPDGTNNEAKLGDYIVDGYWYSLNDTGTGVVNGKKGGETTNITEKTGNVIFKTSTGENTKYWLACCGVHVDSAYAYSGPGFVANGQLNTFNGTFRSYGSVGEYNAPVVPVVPLRSKIPTKIDTPS